MLPDNKKCSINLKALSLAATAICIFFILSACAPPPPPAPPAASVPPPPPAPPERSVIVTVFFPFDSWTLTAESRVVLDNVATAILDPRLAGQSFIIQGHTDIVGRLGYNIALSQLRAASVIDYLTLRGVSPNRLTAEGFGPLRLLDPANPRSGVNRRVEIVTFR